MNDWTRLEIDMFSLDLDRLLLPWSWLVDKDSKPVSLSLFGDWFFEYSEGGIMFLDTVTGIIAEIADSRDDFFNERELDDNADEWYMRNLACACFGKGLNPGAGQCLGYVTPPILGGRIEHENVAVMDLEEYECIMGSIHEKNR